MHNIGNRFFLSDEQAYDLDTWSHLPIGDDKSSYTEYYNTKSICDDLYKDINSSFDFTDLKPAYRNSAEPLFCSASEDYVSVGVVNVMNYSCYKKADKSAYNQFLNSKHSKNTKPIGIETTHGVVVKALKDTCKELKLKKDIPVNFISPIVDRYLRFDEDVDGKEGKQNFICSYNGGIVVANIFKNIELKLINESQTTVQF